jgi:conjugal transfer/entry exclusion protein
LATARLGVEIDAQIYVTETNQVVKVDVFHQVEASLREERRRIASEEELARAVHRRFLQETKSEIEEGDGYKKYVEPS